MHNNVIRLLSIEDSRSDALLIEAMLSKATGLGWDLPRFRIEFVDHLQAALTRLERHGFDVVLTDLDLPDSPAERTFSTLHEHVPHIPIVVLTGREDDGLALETVRAGAEDYIFKREMSGSLLAHALIYAIERQQTKQALKAVQAELEARVAERTKALSVANEELRTEIEERQVVQAALSESEEIFRSVIEQSSDGVVVTDERGDLVVWNEAEAEITGYHRSEVLGRPIWDVMFELMPRERQDAALYDHLRREISICLETGERWWLDELVEKEIERADGERRTCRSSMFVVHTSKGLIIGSTTRDITDLNRTQTRLRMQAQYLDALWQAVIVTDLSGQVTYWNQGAERLYGWSTAEVLGRNIVEITPALAARDLAEEIMARLRQGLSWSGEFLLQHRNGTSFPAIVSDSPVYDESGEMIGVIGITTEITTLKETEQALRESEARYRSLIEATPNAIVVHQDTEVVFVNPAAVALLGAGDPEELVGQPVWRFVLPGFREVFKQRMRDVAEGEITSTMRQKLNRLDGSVVDVEAQSLPFVWEGAPAVEVIARDITDQVAAEDQITRYAAELERRNTDLRQFASMISHDLREPLRAVSGFLTLLEDRCGDRLDTESAEFIDYALDGVERMREMIQAIRELSRVDTEGQDFEPVDTQQILARVLRSLATMVDEAGAEVTSDPLPEVVADAGQLGQVLQNLISNAIKFGRRDVPPRVHISAERDGDDWLFSVRDNGIGIDPKRSEGLFHLFQRLHTREEYAGQGIGLALAKKIVERHGGRIWVASRPGEGATFYFTIPVAPPS